MEKTDFTSKKKIVLKFGTGSLTDKENECISNEKMKLIADNLHYYNSPDREITIVSSGAELVGRQLVGQFQNHHESIDQRRYQALGMAELIHKWNTAFIGGKLKGGYFPITQRTFSDEVEYHQKLESYNDFLQKKYIPICNGDPLVKENINFPDNDLLAAYVTTRFKNDLLIILTSGVMGKDKTPIMGLIKDGRVVENAKTFDRNFYDKLEDSTCGTGGIESKLNAARICNDAGIPFIISSSEKFNLYNLLKGESERTVFEIYPNTLF